MWLERVRYLVAIAHAVLHNVPHMRHFCWKWPHCRYSKIPCGSELHSFRSARHRALAYREQKEAAYHIG